MLNRQGWLIIQFSVGAKVQIIRDDSHFEEIVVVTDHQVVQGNPATTKQLVRYQVELDSGEFQWFDEHELREPVQQSSFLKLNRQWFQTPIGVVLGIVAVLLGAMLLHSRFTVNTPQKAVMAYIKQYPKDNKDVVLSSQPFEYYDGGAYVLGESSDKSYFIYFTKQDSKGQWVAHPVTEFSEENFVGGHSGVNGLSDGTIPGFFVIRSPELNIGTSAYEVVGYEHIVGANSQEIPFELHRLWDSPYWIHYFPYFIFSGSNAFHVNLPAIKIDKVVAYGSSGKIISQW